MITIALDEYGDFEGLRRNSTKNPLFIEGVVYDDNNHTMDAANEKHRISCFLRRVAKDKKCNYPEDLHLNEFMNNRKNVNILEEAVKQALPEFLQLGTYKGYSVDDTERKGTYRIAMMLKSERGKTVLNLSNTSKIIKDTHASNLYMNMAYSIVSRLVFHNPFDLDVKKVTFELATRIIEIPTTDQEARNAYEQLGYKELEIRNGNRVYQVANESNYRTAILRKIVELNKYDLQVENFSVNSICYKVKGEKADKYAFLYLSDMLCSIFQHNKTGNGLLERQQSYIEEAEAILPGRSHLFFAYDGIDDIYEQAIKAFQTEDYYKTLTILYSSKENSSSFTQYYWNKWFPMIEKWIQESTNEESIENAILQFSRYSSSNLLKQDELVYLYEHLEPLVAKLDEKNTYKYKFYDAGITAYNHIGDSVSAEKCFEKCKKYAKYCHFEDYLATLNRRVVMLNDQYRYDEALALSKDILSYHEQLSVLREVLFDTEDITIIAKGRALSQQGQVYSYMRDSEAESRFREALEQFDENSVDYHITLSYLLHHYIDMRNLEGYESYASKYLGNKEDIMDQFAYLQSMTEDEQKNQSFKFAFYVYIKALYTFYADTMNREQKRKVLTWASNVKTSAKKDHVNGHPWELIYKYFALLAVKWNEKDKAEQFVEKMQTIVKEKDAAIENIIVGGLIEYYTAIGDTTAVEEAKNRFKECYTDKEDPVEAEKEKHKLKTDHEKWLVYMFR